MTRPTLPQLRRTVNAPLPRPGECFDARPARLVLGALLGCDCDPLESREYVRDELGRFSPEPFSDTARAHILQQADRYFPLLPDEEHVDDLAHEAKVAGESWRRRMRQHLEMAENPQSQPKVIRDLPPEEQKALAVKRLKHISRLRDRETHALSELSQHISRRRRAAVKIGFLHHDDGTVIGAKDASDEVGADAVWQAHYVKRQKSMDRMKDTFLRQLAYVKSETLRNLEHRRHITRAAAVHAAEGGTAFDVLFDPIRFRDQLAAALRTDTVQALQEAGDECFAELGMDDPFTMPPEKARDFLRQRENLLKDVADEVFDDIKKELQAGHDAGESEAKIAQRLRDKFLMEESRAETVASTETAAAYGYSRQDAMQAAGVTHKKWVGSGLPTMRDTHREASGQIVAIDEPFMVAAEPLMHPGDPAGSAGNVINCHCVSVASEKEDQ